MKREEAITWRSASPPTRGGDITVTGVDGELDVNNVNGEVTLADVSGNAVAHALNGRVLVTFKKVDAGKPMAFSSMNGDIDVTFPPDLKAKVSIKSDRGEVFSDFDIKIDKTVRGTINGGGQEIQFTNFQGSIYLRKAGKRGE